MRSFIFALSVAAMLGVGAGLVANGQQPAQAGVNVELRKLIENNPGQFLPTLSYMCRENVDGVLAKPEWKAALVPTCAAILKASKDEAVKCAAVVFLTRAQEWTADALDPLFGGLDDDSKAVRYCAVHALDLKQAQVQKRLATYQDHKDSGIRLFASVAVIHATGTSDGEMTALLAALEHKDIAIRMAALHTLQQFPSDSRNPVPALLELLKTPRYIYENAEILHALSVHGKYSVEAVPVLKAYLNDGSPNLCVSACQALGRIGPGAHSAVEALRVCLTHRDAKVREAAAEALKCIEG